MGYYCCVGIVGCYWWVVNVDVGYCGCGLLLVGCQCECRVLWVWVLLVGCQCGCRIVLVGCQCGVLRVVCQCGYGCGVLLVGCKCGCGCGVLRVCSPCLIENLAGRRELYTFTDGGGYNGSHVVTNAAPEVEARITGNSLTSSNMKDFKLKSHLIRSDTQ